jgi:hypothetical protein
MKWLKRLPTPRYKSDRIREAARYANVSSKQKRNRKQLTVRHSKAVYQPEYSKVIWVTGIKVRVMTRGRIAKLFNVPLSTVHNWGRLGVLPSPFAYSQNPVRSYPLYLSAEIHCLVLVVKLLLKDGYLSIPWKKLPDHIEMLHAGYGQARKRFLARFATKDEEAGDRYGVTIL